MRSKAKRLHKGEMGEQYVANFLTTIPEFMNNLYVLNNIMIKFPNHRRARQIDHVVICPKGIFVLETKNHGGIAYCTPKTLAVIIGKRTHKSRSPIQQARYHANLVWRILYATGHDAKVTPIVVFTGDIILENFAKLPVLCTKPELFVEHIKSLPDILSPGKCLQIHRDLMEAPQKQ